MAIIVKGSGGKPEEEKTVTAGTSAIEVLPSSGKVMKKVTVNPTPSETKTVTPKASKQTVRPSSGKLLSKVTVNGDSDLVAGNIKKGINIFGVTGSLVEGIDPAMFGATKKEEQTFTVSSSANDKTITHSLGEIPKLVLCFPSEATCSESVGPFGTLMLVMMRMYQGSNFTSYPGYGVYVGIYSPSNLSEAKDCFYGTLLGDMFPSISQVKLYTPASFISGNTYKVVLLA